MTEPVLEPLEGASTAKRRLARRHWLEAALIAGIALTLNLNGNGRVSLFDRDEPRYAACTREMRERGDWLFPTFNGEPRFHKPILIYWLMRAGFALGGDNPFGARLVSAVAGTATSLLVLALGRRMFGTRVGFLAALMLATSPIMVIESKLATTDATLALCFVAAQYCLWELSQRPSKRMAAGFWLSVSLATLTKGPVGLGLVACAGIASWFGGGSPASWRRLHWRWGIPLFLAVTAPWFVAVGILSHGEFFRFALGQQVALRMVQGVEHHAGFPGYYLVTTLLLFHPWSSLIPAAILGAWSRRKLDPTFGFLLGWIIGPLILLECVRTKLVHYYLPAYPACALLASWLIVAVARDRVNLRRWPLGRLGVNLLGGVGIGFAIIFLAGTMVFPAALRGPSLVMGLVIATGTLWGLLRLQRAATSRAVAGLAVTWGIAMLLLGGWMLPAAEPYRLARRIAERINALSDETGASPVLLSFQEPSMIYTMGRSSPMIRKWDRFFDELDRHGAIVTALLEPFEPPEFAKRADALDVDVRETIEGFNLNKGTTQSLRLVLVRRKTSLAGPRNANRASARRSSDTTRRGRLRFRDDLVPSCVKRELRGTAASE